MRKTRGKVKAGGRRRGYTAPELIAIMSVMMFLMSLVLVAARSVYTRTQVARARAMISQLELALSMYEADYGVHPQSAEGQAGTGSIGQQRNGNSWVDRGDFFSGTNSPVPNLVEALSRRGSRGGPYLEFKAKDLVYRVISGRDINGDGQADPVPVLLDPWKQAYVYVSRKYYDGRSSSWQFVGDIDQDGELGDEAWSDMRGPFHPNYAADDRNTTTNERCKALEANTYNVYSLGPDGSTYGTVPGGECYANDTQNPGDWDYSGLYDNYQDGNEIKDSWRKFESWTDGQDPPTTADYYRYCRDDIANWW